MKALLWVIAMLLLTARPAFAVQAVGNGSISVPPPSAQLAPSPSNTNCLTTDGTNNAWASCGGGGGGPTLSATQTWTGVNTYSNTLKVNPFDGIQLQSGPNVFLLADGSTCSGGTSGAAFDFYVAGGPGAVLCGDGSGNISIGLSGQTTAIENGTVAAYPWHPATDPACTVGAGGTSCTATVTVPGPNSMRCSANDEGAALGGVGYSISVSSPSAGVVTITYGAVGVIAGGGTATFSVTCS